ncbi:MAG: Fis family transcriptional regulator [Gammaproteobacteria bacterium 28-57-27]|nr:MAG: Fis family transcriptional regulator [Gammaproteobacteria bacterium 28-57-27]
MSSRPLHETVRSALKEYMLTLEGDDPSDLYAMVIREVERPLLECALEHCAGNQTRAAQCLGLNRGTLRKKLREHDLIRDTAQDLT